MKNFIKAFTLSETLITLSILGVVVAIVITGVVRHYKRHLIEVELKKAYSTLENVLEISKVENGSFGIMIDNTVGSSSDTALRNNYFGENYLKPYLKVVNSCYGGSTSCEIFKPEKVINGTVTEGEDFLYVLNLDGTKSTGNLMSQSNSWYKMELANGTYIGVAWVYQHANQVIFVVDVNGRKKPNRVGYDIFYFSIWAPSNNSKGDGLYAGAYLYAKEKKAENACVCSGDGKGCSAIIKRNGWKIPEDYPVKWF